MDKRTFLAVVICLGIFLVWTGWISPMIWPPPKPVPALKKLPEVEPAPAPLTPTPLPLDTPQQQSKYPEKPPFEVQSKFTRVVFTNKGAGIRELWVHYPDEKVEVPLLPFLESSPPHVALRLVDGPDKIETEPWEVVQQTPEKVEYRIRLLSGVEITKEFTLHPDTHTLGVTLTLDNRNAPSPGGNGSAERALKLEVLAFGAIDLDQPYRYEQYLGGVAFKDGSVDVRLLPAIEKGEQELVKALRIPDSKDRDEEIKDVWKMLKVDGPRKEWFGLKSRFFAVLMAPDGEAQRLLDSYEFRLSSPEAQKKAGGLKNLAASARMDEIRLGGSRKAMQFTLYAGPLRKETLKEVKDAPNLVNYGGGCPLSGLINLVAPSILGVLNFCSSIFRNYGVGIIVTTLLIRLLLFPLSLKSQRSAFQMQALSPKIQALRARYKDDQQKFGVEQMKLFKENKINPLSGCLPLFLQMPIFIGMYSVFEMSIELRRAPFTLWMTDLSQPDQLLKWSTFVIPLLITDLRVDGLNLLPILMTITWFLQAYFTPRSPDPQMASQQKMMMAMPVFFGFMCYGLASGLSLYFLVNSLLGMGEQKLIKKVFLKPPQSLTPA